MMPHRVLLYAAVAFVIAARAAAQNAVYDLDDFVDSGAHENPLFISRLIAGVGGGLSDHYRPLREDVAFAHFANSLYVSKWQFSYKHSFLERENGPADVVRCGCSPPVYFPTPPASNAAPDAPRPGSKDALEVAFYRTAHGETPLRYRLSVSRQQFDTDIHSLSGEVVERRPARDLSITAEGDLDVPIHGHDWLGTFYYSHTVRDGPLDRRSQQELTYMARLPGWLIGRILVRPTIAAGRVTGRGAGGLNVLNPAIEAFWRHNASGITIHLFWSPQSTRSGADGWTTHNQIALLASRPLIVHFFKRPG
jgi:hypothetical protein